MHRYYNLTQPQMSIWESEQFYKGTSIANIGGTLLIKEELKFQLWEKAINKFVEKNDSMRIRISIVEGKPQQYILPYEFFHIPLFDFTGWSKEEEEQWLIDRMEAPFSVATEALCRFEMIKSQDGRCGYMVVLHHLIGDGWTNAIKFGQIMEFYSILAQGENIDSSLNPSYLDYIEKEQIYLNSEKFIQDKAFWMKKFEKEPVQASIKLKDKEKHTSKAKRSSFLIDGEMAHKMNAYCTLHGVSLAVLMESILSVYISRFHDVSELTIGIPVLNRAGINEKSTTGMYVNTLPVKIHIDDQSSFLNLCKNIASEHMQVFRHRKYPMNRLLEDMRKKHHIKHNFYDMCVSYQNGKIEKTNHDFEFSTKWYFNGTQSESLYIHIDDRDNNGSFVMLYDYLIDLFSEHEINDLHNRILCLLNQCITLKNTNICDLELVEPHEREQILKAFNDTAVHYEKNMCIHQCFEEQVAQTPEETAIIFKEQRLSYAKLNMKSNRLAHRLHLLGIKRNHVVALVMNRSENVFIAQMGILKAGACYLPIDPSYPVDRIVYMLEDSGAKVIVTSREIENISSESTSTLKIFIEDVLDNELDDDSHTENPHFKSSPQDPANLIYTSGSTGKPKGAMVSHQGVINFCNASHLNIYGGCITYEMRRIVSVTTISFDMFVTESLLPLLNGMTVVMADEQEQNMQSKLNQLVVREDVHVLQTTPTRMKLLLLDQESLDYLAHIKSIILGGEVFTTALYKQLKKLTNAKLCNIYGPTEITVMCTQTELLSEYITIGKPISNVQIYILDKYMKLVPIGAQGEIFVGGDGVGLGYFNQPVLTQERYVDNPFSLDSKMYKTGDIGSWNDEGNILHHCRNDFQVKINGLRIELGEIENAMLEIDCIESVVVTIINDKNEKQSLCAYYVSVEKIDNERFHKILKESIPGYMIPLFYVRLEKLPVTPNGKVDRKRLPIPSFEEIARKEIVAPRNDFEKIIAGILVEVFEVQKVSIDDHIFYDLGGDSFAAIQIQFLAEKAGINIDMDELYQFPSIREMSANLFNKNENKQYEDMHYSRIFIDTKQKNEKRTIKSVLLTGATGFLGAHLLIQLLELTEAQVICLVRCKERLIESLVYYFGNEYINYLDRIQVQEGNIELSQFGMEPEVYNRLVELVDTVVHAAANVRHFGVFDDFYKTNVSGTKEVIRFCTKSKAKLHHISTISVSGDGIVKQNMIAPQFEELNLYIGQAYQSNVYIHTKYLAEKEVIDAVDQGLDACIYRVGNLMWRVHDGKFQKNIRESGFINRLNAFKKLAILPEMLIQMEVDITPIDTCAKAIIVLANSVKQNEIFHILNHHKVSLKDLLFKLNVNYQVVSMESFIDEVNRNREDEHIGVLYMYLNQLKRYFHSLDVGVKSNKTIKQLNDLGFSWNSLSKEYFSRGPLKD